MTLDESRGPFDKLVGDVVIVHGFRGSRLVDTSCNNEEYWFPEALLKDQVHPPMHLPINIRDNEPHNVVSQGYLANRSYIEYYSDFVNSIQQAADTCHGQFQLHWFDYDFRRNILACTTRFIDYLDEIYQRNGRQSITVIAHSMGGLIVLAALHKQPQLFRGVIFAGTPFNGSITAIPHKLIGSPVGENRQVFSAETHFQLQSTFTFYPFDSRGLVHADDGTDWPLDFHDIDVWLKYKLSVVLNTKETLSIGTYEERVDYLAYVLARARELKALLAYRSDITYPRLVVLAADHLPSPHRYPASLNTDGTLHVDIDRVINAPGDGLITLSSTTPPQGIPHSVVIANGTHMGLLDDMNAVRQAIDLIMTTNE
ncbi:Alpha/Beta hydrolase protein [Syncephalis plumigaleata]|nr:Alpha/Beta hydrolase protein [Syncephalis plumigaleata]